MIIHAVRDGTMKDGKLTNLKFQNDFPKGSDDWKRLRLANLEIQRHYEKYSATFIPRTCTSKLTEGKHDNPLLSETALKVGFVDAVINWETSTMLVRQGEELKMSQIQIPREAVGSDPTTPVPTEPQ